MSEEFFSVSLARQPLAFLADDLRVKLQLGLVCTSVCCLLAVQGKQGSDDVQVPAEVLLAAQQELKGKAQMAKDLEMVRLRQLCTQWAQTCHLQQLR